MSKTAAEFPGLKELSRPDFWRRLAPDYAISARPFEVSPELATVTPSQLDQACELLARDGYLVLPALVDAAQTQRAAQLVQAMTAAGFPAPFALLYDHLWSTVGGVARVFAGVFGAQPCVLPDYWIWQVDGHYESHGWEWHRDDKFEQRCFDEHGRPLVLTVWFAFTDALPENGCIHVVPQSLDPNCPGNLRSMKVGPELEHAVRAVPAEAGSVLAWNMYVLHAGGSYMPGARGPRISLGIYMEHPDAPTTDGRAIKLSDDIPFSDRLGAVARMVLRYADRYSFDPRLVDCCRTWAAFYGAVSAARANEPIIPRS